ncbi:patatin-like phospholipase family protein [uncultured Deefgea sp.]|uniref:patatin-like phospholipase family protein n=1 Tax=uncultured Deefgea sp. TaxID=1304914 RepID=UPI002594F585|nr:patatin-like phospholipase family protein [uncultured Deefgea sp.]
MRIKIASHALVLIYAILLSACATRSINPPISQVDVSEGYRFFHGSELKAQDPATVFMLAFSGGGTRAAAFSYGVLEALRATPIHGRAGANNLLEEVDYITGVSGGSFTALAYGLYGERLFEEYEARFLKRDVQGTLFNKWINPINWPNMWQPTYSRSDMSQAYYDEILFNNATFGDLLQKNGPRIIVSATEAASSFRFTFSQDFFDLICSDLSAVKLSRAATASSAVPILFTPITFNNYGLHCGANIPAWVDEALQLAKNKNDLPIRTLQRIRELKSIQNSDKRPFLHLADGGISDNLGARLILELLEALPLIQEKREANGEAAIKNIAFIIVNASSSPTLTWGTSAQPPNEFEVALRAIGTPIDQYSYETISLIEDMAKALNQSRRLQGQLNGKADLPITVTPIVLSFAQIEDDAERAYFDNLPTSFVLAPEQVDRLRQLSHALLKKSPQYQDLIQRLQLAVDRH